MNQKILYLTVTLILSPILCAAAQTNDPSLVAWWRLNDANGTIAADSVGGNDGALYGDAQWTSGRSGGGLYLDEDGDYLEVPNILAEQGAVAFWFKPDWDGTDPADYRLFDASLDGIYFFISKGANHADINPEDFGFYLEDVTDADYQGIEFDPAGTIFARTWFHVAVTWEFGGGPAIIYINGEEVARADSLGGFPALNANPRFGYETFSYIPISNGAKGTFDEILIYNRALSAEEIQPLMAISPEPTGRLYPEHEDTDIPRDVVLSWNSGEFPQTYDVYLGSVWEDVNNASADDPLDVLLSLGQIANTFDVGRLAFGQTYFWRVDRVNGSSGRTVFKGDVWSFTIEPEGRPITDITATASSSNDLMGPERTVDGSGLNELDQHSTLGTDMWLSGMGDPVPTIQYAFDKPYKLQQMLVWNSNQLSEPIIGLGARDVVVETSVDGGDWSVVEGAVLLNQAQGSPDYTANNIIDLGAVLAKSVRISIQSGWGFTAQSGISEVRFLYIPTFARLPEPPDGSVVDGADVVLGWRAGREAALHEVYLGTDPADQPLVATTPEASYTAHGLDLSTTYYWSITEVNENEAVTAFVGDVWSLTTPDYWVVVDDFEQYDDDCNRIYFTWEDSLGHNGGQDIEGCDVPPSDGYGGGSIVGNYVAPFAERTTVNSGGSTQSLPFEYQNAFGESFATRAIDGRDWTAGGIKTFAIAFYGTEGNTGTLYIKINNTKILYDRDPADISRAEWQTWNVDLNGVSDLQNVTSLTIGVEGARAAGMLYIDDIGLYPPAGELITQVDAGTSSLVTANSF